MERKLSSADMRFSQVVAGAQGLPTKDEALALGEKAAQATAGGIKVAGSEALNLIKGAQSGLADGANAVYDKLKGAPEVGQKVRDGLKDAGNAIADGAKTAGGAIKDGAVVAGNAIKDGAVIAGRKISEGYQAAKPHLKKAGIAISNAAKAAGSATLQGSIEFYHNFMTGEQNAIAKAPPAPDASQYKVKPIDIEDCTACKFIWHQVEMDVGNTPLEEEIFKSFQSNCAEASLSRIFYPSCSMMSNHIQDFIIDYNKGFDPNQMCEHNGMCRRSLLFYGEGVPHSPLV